jgi:hypothetical protein
LDTTFNLVDHPKSAGCDTEKNGEKMQGIKRGAASPTQIPNISVIVLLDANQKYRAETTVILAWGIAGAPPP